MAIKFSDITGGGIPYGNNAGRPASPTTGKLYSNGEAQRLELYTSAGSWENIVQEVPGVSSISGNYSQQTDSGTIIIYGTNFVNGAYATAIGSNGSIVNAASTTFNSLVQLTATFTGLSNSYEPYDIKVTNPSNLFGMLSDALYVNASPVWTTSSGSLGTFNEQVSVSVSATATDSDSTITYALASGSTLPSGVTLNSSTGVISGTLPDISSDTTYTFTINATDGVNTIPRSFSITSNYVVIAEYLIVGAGGNGGFDNGVGATAGGGGAGGYLSGSQTFTRNVAINLSVGAAPAASTAGTGYMGQNSYINSLIAYAGGAGQYYGGSPLNYYPATSGGSGGGGGYSQRTGGAGTSGQGNAGGDGVPNSNSPYTGAGGGGAGGVGVSPGSNGTGGAGGPGISNSITGTAIIYAAGGGGHSSTGGAGGSNGVGGAGASGSNAAAGNGAANTGSGGGGKFGSSSTGGNGSAGVIVIAYPNTTPAPINISAGLTYDQPTRSGYRVYRFTAGTGTITF